ncbi:Putative intracellular protease/amidase [Sphingobacterium nematocida]|uniref:Putative intracellular protease/amidase n=1 Tax=Sphingobacterium nematocida TaxID=1513896 RepID=A0A1T5ASE4_9SPHI|nr:type 1 glutamine amidotransferase domain-containing protein [Sphingobacterium nematocida]SKB37740.1 Putative intracellular protease/amidase [Sphingobacterium nematocida]
MEQKNTILMMLTSHDRLDNTEDKTGVWLGEMTDPYYELLDAGFVVMMCSPLGGAPPVDPMSKLTEHITASNRRFLDDEVGQHHFKNTLPLENIKASAFDAVFIAGGHGPLWDLARHPHVGRILCEFVDQEKPIAAVCHGPAALFAMEACRPGYLQGRRLTAFTNMEESIVMRKDNIPYELETRLVENGADFTHAVVPFMAHVVLDENLITGQNPLSAAPAARTLIELIRFAKPL